MLSEWNTCLPPLLAGVVNSSLRRTRVSESRSHYDYAISPEIFHWQTRNNAGPDTPAGRRYIESLENALPLELFRAFSVPRA